MRKKLFAVIMSAMMMITFMPSMAFAVDTITYSATVTGAHYDKLVVTLVKNGTATTDTVSVDVQRTMDDGLITANVTDAETALVNKIEGDAATYAKFVDGTGIVAGGVTTALGETEDITFYDFTGATIVKNDGTALNKSILRTQFSSFFSTSAGVTTLNSWAIMMSPQSYVTLTDAQKADTTKAYALAQNFGDWDAKVVLSGYDDENTAAQTATLTTDFTADSGDTVSEIMPNSVLTTTMTIGEGVVPTVAPSAVKFYVDGDETTAEVPEHETTPYVYDGAEHKIEMQKANGVTVAFAKYNKRTAKWDAVSEIAWKNVTEETQEYKVTITNNADSTDVDVRYFDVDVDKATINAALDLTNVKIYEGDKYQTKDYIKFTGSATADSNAAKADEAALKNFVDTYYDLDATLNENTNVITFTVSEKTLTAEEQAAKVKAQANWTVNVTSSSETVTILPATKVNELDFLGGATKKVHIKKAKKISKAKYVTVKAESLSGVAPTFKKLSGNSKISVAKSGKVTLKKGLKKGTYKVKVKATVAEGKGYFRKSATRTYTIKVVK